MPITRSAKKAHRASLRKRSFNIARKAGADKAVKEVKKLINEGKAKEARTALAKAQAQLDKAAKMKTISKNLASRKKSRLSKMAKKIAK